MDYRKATAEDIPQLVELRITQLTDEGMRPVVDIREELNGYFMRELRDDRLIEWIAEEDGVIVATSALAFFPFPPSFVNTVGTRGYVTNMYTAPSHRGRGIARDMMRLVIREAQERGLARLVLSASEMGKPVYRELGFTENDTWMDYIL